MKEHTAIQMKFSRKHVNTSNYLSKIGALRPDFLQVTYVIEKSILKNGELRKKIFLANL